MKRFAIVALLLLSATLAAQQPGPAVPRPGTSPSRPTQVPLLKSRQGDRLFPPTALGLLEAPDRADWNKPDLIMDSLGIADGSVVADLGAGSGWFTIQLARRVGPNGLVYGQDIQPEMIEVINRRVQTEAVTNVRTVRGTQTDPRLPSGIDVVLIVDAYHEMDEPSRPDVILTLLQNVARSLKSQGRLGIVDFLPGDGGPGPAAADRVDERRVIRSAEAAGFLLQSREAVPPFQYLLVFTKTPAPARRAS